MDYDAAQGLVHIVDDDAAFRRAVSRALISAGLDTQEYEGVPQYLGSGMATRKCCVLLDMFMPDGTAFELLQTLPQADFPPPVILLTACGELANTVNTMKAGAVDYLVKPVETTQLLRSVHRALCVDEGRQPTRVMAQRVRRQFTRLGSVERSVFVGIANGRINKQLSVELNVCERTIKSLRAEVMVKMQAESVPTLVRYARLLGLTEAPTVARAPAAVSFRTCSRIETRSTYSATRVHR